MHALRDRVASDIAVFTAPNSAAAKRGGSSTQMRRTRNGCDRGASEGTKDYA